MKCIFNGLHYEITEHNATLLGFAKASRFVQDNIPNLIIPDYVENVPVTVVEKFAFKDVEEIEKIIFPKHLKKIKTGAFYGCLHLKKVTMPNIKNHSVILEDFAFAQCLDLEDVELMCSLSIQKYAFQACNKLKTVCAAITQLDNFVFEGCKNLQLITIQENASIMCLALTQCKIENIRCMGTVRFEMETICDILEQEANILCEENSEMVDLAYCGVPVSFI